MKNLEQKINKVAREYIQAHTRYALWDCGDSMREKDVLEGKWEILTDNEPTLKDYIKENLYEEYKEEVRQANKELGEDLAETIDTYGSDLLLPYDGPVERKPVIKGVLKCNLYYVDDYTFQERFDEGELLTSGQILGTPDWERGKEVVLKDGLWRCPEELEEGYYLPENSKHVVR